MNYFIISKDSFYIKIRGCYKTIEEANKNISQFKNIGLKNIFICKNEYITNNINYKDIFVVNDIYGKPKLIINNKLKLIMKKKFKYNNFKIFLSLSDEKNHSIAFVIINFSIDYQKIVFLCGAI